MSNGARRAPAGRVANRQSTNQQRRCFRWLDASSERRNESGASLMRIRRSWFFMDVWMLEKCRLSR